MRKEAVVLSVDAGVAQVLVQRDSACGDCASCGGCSGQQIRIKVKNTLDVEVGQRIIIEMDTGTIIGVAALVYLLPLLLFFVCYAVGTALCFHPVILGIAGFILAFFGAFLLNRRLSNRMDYRMVDFAEEPI